VRKTISKNAERPRFTADEIVRAIDAVTKAGLTVQSVEITHSGSIKIETQPLKQGPSKATTAPDIANVQDEILKKKAGMKNGDANLRAVFIALVILIVIFFWFMKFLLACSRQTLRTDWQKSAIY
jgi:hypothetical protein